MSKISFSTTARKLKGKKVGQLRRQGLTPGNIYLSGSESVAIQFAENEFNKLYDEVGDTGLVYLAVGEAKKTRPTLIDEVQVDPASGRVLHVSFKEVNLKEKIEAEVPVELVGELDIKEAVVVQVLNSVMVEALPSDLPEKFEIDLTRLTEVGQVITLADLEFDKTKVTLVEVDSDEDWQKTVVLIQEQRQEEVAEEVVADGGGEGEGDVEKTKAKGESESEAKTDEQEAKANAVD